MKSLVSSAGRDNLYYIRGRSTMQVSLRDFYDAFTAFRSGTCETTALRQFRPHVFDSAAKGHSCNCTFFFLVLQKAGLAGEISGTGVRGNAFRANISEALPMKKPMDWTFKQLALALRFCVWNS